MVDRYCREIKSIKDNIKNSLEISSILLKLKEYDEKLSGIDTNEKSISSNLTKIGNNENSISSNLGKIGNNENSISSNLTKIGNNETNISSNLTKIGNNKTNISSDLTKIGNNENSISSNKTKINNIENNMSIRINKDIYEKEIIISNMTTNYDTKKIASININLNFTTNGVIKINAIYNYSDNNNFSHIYKFYNNNQKFEKLKLNHKSNVINDKFDIPRVNSTRISLLIYLVNNNNDNSLVNLFDNDNVIINYNDKIDTLKVDMNTDNISTNSTKIKDNENDISSNLIDINTNEDNIAYNLSEIENIKKTSISYLKNIYDILLYDKKPQVDFKNLFYEKVFDISGNINDFIEMEFKILLEYENIVQINYINIIYEIFDENDNSLYIKLVANNEYSYFSNKFNIIENIFYNFTKNVKKIKFVIKFQMVIPTIIKIWYTKNDNYRLVIKNYGL